jgi:hypothetical protein
MRLPIDISTIKFAMAGPAEPVVDFATKSAKTNTQRRPSDDGDLSGNQTVESA